MNRARLATAVIALAVTLIPLASAASSAETPSTPSETETLTTESPLPPVEDAPASTPPSTSPYGTDTEIEIALDDDGNVVPATP
jgi:hypothetical protein